MSLPDDLRADAPADPPPRWVGPTRLGVGLVQGLLVYALIRLAEVKWPAAHGAAFSVLLLATAFVPLILLAALGRMRPAVLAGWAAAAAALVTAVGLYGWWRDPVGSDGQPATGPSAETWVATAVLLYVLHHLLEPADEARTLRPPYPARFEGAWRHGFQLAVSWAFTGVFWGVLQLGAGLFDLIGVKALSTLLRQGWFIAPATAAAFAAAVHLTDVRPGLIRGVRTVGLTLLAWLLPLMAALAAAFLLALLFTGVGPLWRTQKASVVLLAAAGVLVLLINAAYQDGRESPARVPGWAGRLAAMLLPVLAGLSAWAAGLRIAQYGLTPERVVGLALTAVTALYGVGYAAAAVRRGPWMRGLEGTNVAAAWTGVALLLLLLSPVLDPARLSADDQTHRLRTGRLPAAGFDYAFLRFRAARFGREALARLARSPDPKVARDAAYWRDQASANARTAPVEHRAPRSALVAGPGPVPSDFLAQRFADDYGGASCLVDDSPCRVMARDLDGDRVEEVLVLSPNTLVVFKRRPDGVWARAGSYGQAFCTAAQAALARGAFQPAPAGLPDLEAGGQRLAFQPVDGLCAPGSDALAPSRAPPPRSPPR